MNREDVQKLLGGYATGTLTPEEQRTLFEAALEDQELFDALAREEALKEVLSDPGARARLLAVAGARPERWHRRWVPLAALAAALLVVSGVAVWHSLHPKPLRMAKLNLPPASRPGSEAAPSLPPPPDFAPAAPPVAPFSVPGVIPAPPAAQPRFQPSAGLAFLSGTVPLHVVVTDAAGAPLPSATVEVKSAATGDVFRAPTDEHGVFNAPAAPGSTYQISASAPGFQSRTVSRVTPPLGEPDTVNLQLDAGVSVATTGAMPGATPFVSPGPAGVGGAAGGVANGTLMAPRARPPFTYHLLRRMPAGDLAEVSAEGTVPPNAPIILRITPPADGYLRIVQNSGPTIVNAQVRRAVEFETELPKIDTPGRVELQVYFSQQPVAPDNQPPALTIAINIQ
jgi:Carboxypeptidase regulatory-like domain